MTDSLGDYLKSIEEAWNNVVFDAHNNWIYVRLDGRAFHTFTRGLTRPFDPSFTKTMIDTAKDLGDEFKPDFIYVQSDEISLAWRKLDNPESQFLFGGKYHKLVSVLASACTTYFVRHMWTHFSSIGSNLRSGWATNKYPTFDCRVVPMSEEDCLKMLYWRTKDCYKNAVSAIAQSLFTAKELHGKHIDNRIAMIHEHTGTHLDSFDGHNVYGTLMWSYTNTRPLNEEEKANIPKVFWPETITRREWTNNHIHFGTLAQFIEFATSPKIGEYVVSYVPEPLPEPDDELKEFFEAIEREEQEEVASYKKKKFIQP